jgi:hypothetical protein
MPACRFSRVVPVTDVWPLGELVLSAYLGGLGLILLGTGLLEGLAVVVMLFEGALLLFVGLAAVGFVGWVWFARAQLCSLHRAFLAGISAAAGMATPFAALATPLGPVPLAVILGAFGLVALAAGCGVLFLCKVLDLMCDPVLITDGRHCLQCGYLLIGNCSGVCPECGTKLGRAAELAQGRPEDANGSPPISEPAPR